MGVAESAEGMETAPFDSELFQNRVQPMAQDVALAKRFSIARAEDVSALAVTDEVGKQLRHVGVEVNDAIGVLRLWCLSIASPHRLLDFDTAAIEVPDFKTEQFTGTKSRRRIEDEKHSHFDLGCCNNLRDLLAIQRRSALLSSINDRCVDELCIPPQRIEFIAVLIYGALAFTSLTTKQMFLMDAGDNPLPTRTSTSFLIEALLTPAMGWLPRTVRIWLSR
jgi:hypothetical protein